MKEGRAARAIIPIENSQHGRVADIHFLLPESGLSIVGEYFLPISYALMALGDGPFTAAYSHPQALGQTRHYLRERGIVPMAYADTAGAAAYRARNAGRSAACAIAPRIAAELYGLKIVAEGIEDAADNTTRFVVLAKKPLDRCHADRQAGDDHAYVRSEQHAGRALQGDGRTSPPTAST